MAKKLKYLWVVLIPICGYVSFYSTGWKSFLLFIFAFGVIPLLELFFKPDEKNLSKIEEELIKDDPYYDFLVYCVVPIHYALLFLFLNRIYTQELSWVEVIGYIFSMGVLNGVFGINVAHELGHRVKSYEKIMAKLLLLSTLYMHFYIEHNRGHHKNVSTPNDPASSKRNESLYAFWFRSIIFSYLSAWKLEIQRLKNKNLPFWSFHNEMIRFHVFQLFFVLLIYLLTNAFVTFCFIASSIIGWLLLETVNYIEHYGLARKEIKPGIYERVMPHHSWNSNHILGRIFLFELSRHSDHHYKASRKYQILQHHQQAPQMPTGYPGMMLLSLIPPLWFYVMNRHIDKYFHEHPDLITTS